MALYKITFGNGTAWVSSYVIRTEFPTTDYGALVDCLIDYLVGKGSSEIVDMDEWEWDDNYETLHMIDNHSWVIYPDEFIQGGNCGNVLRHYGMFDIREIKNSEVTEEDKIIEMSCEDCKHFYECDNMGHYENCNMCDFERRKYE